jgi:parallel beta-helix repeat protein
MPYTNFPNGATSFGVPLHGSNSFGWKNQGDIWFVDGTFGSDGNSGKDPDNAFATVGKAVGTTAATGLANAYDAVYILDKGHSGTDPNPYLETGGNLSVPFASNNLAIVGVPHNMHYQYGLQIKGDAVATTAVLHINAPFCAIENLSFNRGASTTGGIYFDDEGDSTNQAQGSSVYNCYFRNLRGTGNGSTGGAIVIDGGWNYLIQKCIFYNNRGGIVIKSSAASTVEGVIIRDSQFFGAVANVDTYIHTSGTCARNIYDNLVFASATPAYSGGLTAYVYDDVSSDSILSNSTFGGASLVAGATTTNAIVIGTGVRIANCHDESGLLART